MASTVLGASLVRSRAGQEEEVKEEGRARRAEAAAPCTRAKCAADLPDMLRARYSVTRHLSSGSFGDVYVARDLKHGADIAIKVEPLQSATPQIEFELCVYKELQDEKTGNMTLGFPRILARGTTDEHRYMVMELLGPSLEDRRRATKTGTLQLRTILMVAMQTLMRIEFMHSRGLLHRDLKPDNLLTGLAPPFSAIVHLVDMGLVKRYRDSEGRHIPEAAHKLMVGTPRYASVANHEGREQSRRDDLEGLLYTLVFLHKGRLPWQDPIPDSDTAYARQKRTLASDALCAGMDSVFAKIHAYVRSLSFSDIPDYRSLRAALRACAERNHIALQGGFEWDDAA